MVWLQKSVMVATKLLEMSAGLLKKNTLFCSDKDERSYPQVSLWISACVTQTTGMTLYVESLSVLFLNLYKKCFLFQISITGLLQIRAQRMSSARGSWLNRWRRETLLLWFGQETGRFPCCETRETEESTPSTRICLFMLYLESSVVIGFSTERAWGGWQYMQTK